MAKGSDERREGSGDDLAGRLDRLDKALERRGAGRDDGAGSGPVSSRDAQGIARGFRLSTEMVAGVIVGGGLGWALDRWLDTSPFGLIVLLLLGFAAGVLNVMRAAGIARHPGADDHPPL
ncbi:ATP synthase protein I [Methylopila jiangsuensis]|uniref:ATP synthase protein I n=1 Tax=Methylopila jiangsuensis TaxID=586230 RepID=A0A9W6JJW8_9HYPH|nr:AtpZ/AtpI family protein [Methylopila jiangsuensis]MDR6286586.1 ATP synthase protein I [Methylopila jiangsuensis]GLK77074.1 ATP synthase protein I [Methylopila jiangsuensis]